MQHNYFMTWSEFFLSFSYFNFWNMQAVKFRKYSKAILKKTQQDMGRVQISGNKMKSNPLNT